MIYVPLALEKILNRIGILNFVRVGYKLRILDRSFKIPVIEDKVGLTYHQSVTEPFLLTLFKRLYSNIDYAFLDVGVNFGQTLLKLKAVSNNATYIGFEPSGLCTYYVSQLIKMNGL